DFDFSGSKGFILRVSAGVDAETGIATWLLQAIDPNTGEVMRNATRGLLEAVGGESGKGFVSYTVRTAGGVETGSVIVAAARVLIDEMPALDSASHAVSVDAGAPRTALAVTALGDNLQGEPTYELHWEARDDASGVRSVTLYVAENGGDFRIWQRQLGPEQTQAIFTGERGKQYEFLAVATDRAGNREAASVLNAVLPDDGARQAVLNSLGVLESLNQTPELPLPSELRAYPPSNVFAQAAQLLPGAVATVQRSELGTVLAPFTLRGFAEGYRASAGDIGAQGLVELSDGRFLASAGVLRNQVFVFDKDGGRSVTPLFELDAPIVDMAVDAYGQLWVMTGNELLLVDAGSGAIIERMQGPGGIPLTHALAVEPESGRIFLTSGAGILVFDPAEDNRARAWSQFSNFRAGDLAFGPDGRLWAVRWSGSTITAAASKPQTEIVSFPMSGRYAGRAELEFRLDGVVDSIAFGQPGSALEGLLFASCNLPQRAVLGSASAVPRTAGVWMMELGSKRIVQLASGGTRGESVVTTADGRILVAQTGRIDEIALARAPEVVAVTVPDGALMPLPMNRIGVVFDQAMFVGQGREAGSVLNAANFTLTALGQHAGAVFTPTAVHWDAATRTAWLDVTGLGAGQYQLEVRHTLRSDLELALGQSYLSTFTALNDMSAQVQMNFTGTRSDRGSGTVSYDVSITNIGADDLLGPLMLLLDPGAYFGGSIEAGAGGGGDQSELWVLDLTTALQGLGGKLAVGATLAGVTVSIVPAGDLAPRGGIADLVKANLGHGIYAYPHPNLPPQLTVAGVDDVSSRFAYILPGAVVGEAWSGEIEAIDADGTRFYWQLVQAPAGMTLTPAPEVRSADGLYRNGATLSWTPGAGADVATEVLVRVQDSRGGFTYRYFQIAVEGGNNAPTISVPGNITLTEGESLNIPVAVADVDGDPLTVTVRNLPPGAVFDAASGMLRWTPGYDQGGVYENVTIIASDGKRTVERAFTLTVRQGLPLPQLLTGGAHALREGDRFALQLLGSVDGGLRQPDGSVIELQYLAQWLPSGASLNRETGWFEWTPDYNQNGIYKVPLKLLAKWTDPQGVVRTSAVSAELVLEVANANGAPVFAPAETWQVLEGQPLRISVFAFDPDNPAFQPAVQLSEGGAAAEVDSTPPTVSYALSGLPEGAHFNPDTLEIVWTPGYHQAGSYTVLVTATDDGDGTGAPAVAHLVVPIVVHNANRAPQLGDISNAFVDRGAVIEIPVSASDADGNPVELSFAGLPRFATYTSNPSADPSAPGGVLRFAPGAGDRGDYVITVTARDDGDGDARQALTESRAFVLTVRSTSEAPVITAPAQVVAIAGQPLSVALLATDLDQDALVWSADGLPPGATLTPGGGYGHAVLNWTPSAAASGVYDLTVA
ncbi:MAG TPA: hypothetical protein DCY18_00810, partial [Thauera sp.]|nr:hypothetical protein [Thauera sp.]